MQSTKVVIADQLYIILPDVEETLQEQGITSIDDMYDLPRHDPRLVKAVESYMNSNPNQTTYSIEYVIGRYIIHCDVNGYETLYSNDSNEWVNI